MNDMKKKAILDLQIKYINVYDRYVNRTDKVLSELPIAHIPYINIG